MKRITLSIAAFLGVQLVGAYIMWMGGFNFDDRNPFIGYLAFVFSAAGVLTANAVYDEMKEKK